MNNFINTKNFKIKAIISFMIFAVVFFVIDWSTKHFLFDGNKVNWENKGTYEAGTEKDYVVIGLRSVAHDNSTIFAFLDVKIPDWAYYLMTFVMATIFAIIPFFVRSILLGIVCGIIFAGIMGNSLDKVFSVESAHYQSGFGTFVRDIFYFPWLDRGTFNFADVSIITGTLLLIFYIVTSIIKGNNSEN